MSEPLVVMSIGGIFKKDFRYLTSSKVYAFTQKALSGLYFRVEVD
jgi:hypothetical protein